MINTIGPVVDPNNFIGTGKSGYEILNNTVNGTTLDDTSQGTDRTGDPFYERWGITQDDFGWKDQASGAAQSAVASSYISGLEADRNREWQEYMSNTAYQRSMADLEAAGINPAAAYMSSGGSYSSASSSGGSAASASSPSSSESLLGKLLSAAASVALALLFGG